MTTEERLKLDRRIHNQRVALRENWMAFEQRANFVGSWYIRRKDVHDKLLSIAIRLHRENSELKAELAKRERA